MPGVRREPHLRVMNRLEVSLQHSIVALAANGWSHRRIARKLKVNRETVGRYLRLAEAKPAISTPGSEPQEGSKPAISTAGSEAGRQSLCRPWQSRIEEALVLGLSAQRIYQDLVADHGFAGSYQAVKRFVRRLRQSQPRVFERIEVEPGAEAQVDFGQGAWVEEPGRRRRPYIFRVVLSHSRKGYTEAVWRQTTENFIRCLENAFRHFGGVPQTLIIDNLRAAVTRSDWFEPELNPKVEEFCRHYGTVILPTRPAKPHHKGKVEAAVKYVQNNALKGRRFPSLRAQNLFLSDWERSVADTRIHGTTRRQVATLFAQREQPALQPLPASLFPTFEEAQRIVHRDGYIELQGAFYSVPPEYVRRTVWVRWEPRLVRVFNQRREPIALHPRADPGQFATDANHLRSPYRHRVQHGLEYLLDRACLLGTHTGSWAQAMIQQRGPAGVRILYGLLSLARKHPVAALERATAKALHHGAWRLRDLRALLDQPGPADQLDFLETHPLIRSLQTYQDCVPDCFASATSNPQPCSSSPP